MQTASLDSLALQLPYGFFEVHFAEISCFDCGEWRCGVEHPSEQIACPGCGKVRTASQLGCRGFTRNPGTWERVRAGLSPSARGWVLAKVDEASQIARKLQKRRVGRGHPQGYKNEIDPVDFTWSSKFA